MSMSVKQRRTEVLEEIDFPSGKARLVKASSKYDLRNRHLAVEWCPARFVGTDHEEYAYRVLHDWWPTRDPSNQAEARAFFTGAWKMLQSHGEVAT